MCDRQDSFSAGFQISIVYHIQKSGTKCRLPDTMSATGELFILGAAFMGHFEINGLSKNTFYGAGDVSILLPRCGSGFLVETVEAGNRLGSRGKT